MGFREAAAVGAEGDNPSVTEMQGSKTGEVSAASLGTHRCYCLVQGITHRGTAIPQQQEAARTRAWPRAPSTLLSEGGQITRVSKPVEQPNLSPSVLTPAQSRDSDPEKQSAPQPRIRKPRLPSHLTAPK